MDLKINGETRSFDEDPPTTLSELLDRLEVPAARGVAVAVNDAVIPRGSWEDQGLTAGDRVEILRATQGG